MLTSFKVRYQVDNCVITINKNHENMFMGEITDSIREYEHTRNYKTFFSDFSRLRFGRGVRRG